MRRRFKYFQYIGEPYETSTKYASHWIRIVATFEHVCIGVARKRRTAGAPKRIESCAGEGNRPDYVSRDSRQGKTTSGVAGERVERVRKRAFGIFATPCRGAPERC